MFIGEGDGGGGGPSEGAGEAEEVTEDEGSDDACEEYADCVEGDEVRGVDPAAGERAVEALCGDSTTGSLRDELSGSSLSPPLGDESESALATGSISLQPVGL